VEIKATLNKPYTEEQRISFIVEQNHQQGYEIRETDTELQAWGKTKEEKQQEEAERVGELTMTALDFITFLRQCGLTLEQIRAYLNANIELDTQLTYCQNVYCKVARAIMPITLGDITITAEMVEQAFKRKNGEE
jgi:DNA-binding transcriptional MerR regulator